MVQTFSPTWVLVILLSTAAHSISSLFLLAWRIVSSFSMQFVVDWTIAKSVFHMFCGCLNNCQYFFLGRNCK
jgi:low affinity Fe/Cu permease